MTRKQGLWNNSSFRRLYAAHATSLLGSGLGGVALGLLAYELVGASAPMVLGVALTIRIVVIMVLSPWAGLIADRWGSKPTLIACDILRAVVVIGFLFATQLWQIYALAVLLNAGSALFTPIYKSIIPGVVGEKDYPHALAWGTAAYDTSNILGPTLAALVIALAGFEGNFVLNAIAFGVSGWLIIGLPRLVTTNAGPQGAPAGSTGAWHGMRSMLTRWPLRVSLFLALQASIAGAFVLVGTIGLVKTGFGLGDTHYAWLMAAYGAGSVGGAFAYAKFHKLRSGIFQCTSPLMVLALFWAGSALSYGWMFPAWMALGAGQAILGVKGNELLATNSGIEERASIFSAHFALSHAGWGLAYPLAGWTVSQWGFTIAALGFGSALVLVSLPLWIYQVWMWAIHRGNARR